MRKRAPEGDLVNDQHGSLRMPNAMSEAVLEVGRRVKRGKQDLLRQWIWEGLRSAVRKGLLPRALLPPNWGRSEAGRPPEATVEPLTKPRKRGISTRPPA